MGRSQKTSSRSPTPGPDLERRTDHKTHRGSHRSYSLSKKQQPGFQHRPVACQVPGATKTIRISLTGCDSGKNPASASHWLRVSGKSWTLSKFGRKENNVSTTQTTVATARVPNDHAHARIAASCCVQRLAPASQNTRSMQAHLLPPGWLGCCTAVCRKLPGFTERGWPPGKAKFRENFSK